MSDEKTSPDESLVASADVLALIETARATGKAIVVDGPPVTIVASAPTLRDQRDRAVALLQEVRNKWPDGLDYSDYDRLVDFLAEVDKAG